MLLIQRILTEYQQGAAGGPGSQRRARVPMGLALQAMSSSTQCIEQRLIAAEPEFELRVRETLEHDDIPQNTDFLRVTLGTVYFRANALFQTLPEDLALPLDKEPWVRIRFNRRSRTTYSVTWYEDYVLNVAMVDAGFAPDMFLGEPGRVYDFRRERR